MTRLQRVYPYGVATLLLAAVLAIIFGQQAVLAEENINTTTNTLKVSPVRSDISIKPGNSSQVDMTVTNLTDDPIVVRPIQNDFIAGDERGTPALILDETEFAPTHSLKRFMKPLQNVNVPANKSLIVRLTVSVPADTKAGGYFGAVRFAPSASDDGNQVNLSASVASLILLTVPGDTIEDVKLTNFDVEQNGIGGGFFNSTKNILVATRFENKGGGAISPFGKISVMQNGKVIYDTDFNSKQPREVILPDSARRWDIPLRDLGGFGKHTVAATFTYGESNKTIEVTKTFWIIPWIVILVVVGLILAIAGIVFGIRLFLKRYEQKVLSRRRGRR